MRKIFVIFLIFFLNATTYAKVTCPPFSLIKGVRLIKPMQSQIDPDVWDFTSNIFLHDNKQWNVWFGTFFHGTIEAERALFLANQFFLDIKVSNEHPTALETPSGFFCEYMPPSHAFWLTAVTPPA